MLGSPVPIFMRSPGQRRGQSFQRGRRSPPEFSQEFIRGAFTSPERWAPASAVKFARFRPYLLSRFSPNSPKLLAGLVFYRFRSSTVLSSAIFIFLHWNSWHEERKLNTNGPPPDTVLLFSISECNRGLVGFHWQLLSPTRAKRGDCTSSGKELHISQASGHELMETSFLAKCQ